MSHSVELIAVGTELLLGSIVNTNAAMLSRELSALGLNVYYHTVVGDNPTRLRAAVEQARARADIIITTGGLGPTCDDLTKQTLSACFDLPLVFHADIADRIRTYFESRLHNITMPENNLQQAELPAGCTILENDWGTAPGCAFEVDGTHVIMLPGPPSECTPMFRHRAAPYLRALSEGVIASRSLRLFGMGESAVEQELREQMNTMENPTLAPYAKEGEMELRITAKANTEEEALARIAPVERELRERFGGKIYGVNVESLEAVVLDLLREKNLTLAAAESCTGGLVAKRMTDLPGASAVFCGSAVCYATETKSALLGVSDTLLEEFGAVSPQVAEAMARGARAAFGAHLAVATTGVAGPDADENGNPVGLVYVALAYEGGVAVRKLNLGSGRGRIRTTAAHHAFDMVRRHLEGLPMKD